MATPFPQIRGNKVSNIRDIKHGDSVQLVANGSGPAILIEGIVDGFPWASSGNYRDPLDSIRLRRLGQATIKDYRLDGYTVYRQN